MQIIEAMLLCYINALSHPTLGFATITCLDLLTHLWNMYGTITQAELDENVKCMNTPWSPPTPMETLFKQHTNAHAFAITGGDQMNEIMFVCVSCNII